MAKTTKKVSNSRRGRAYNLNALQLRRGLELWQIEIPEGEAAG
jgi:hypothetical protein